MVGTGLLIQKGRLIRTYGVDWRQCILWSFLNESWEKGVHVKSVLDKDLVEQYIALFKRITDFDLERAYEIKPMLDGSEVCRLLNIKPSAAVAKCLNSVLEWQIEHPNATKHEAEVYVGTLEV